MLSNMKAVKKLLGNKSGEVLKTLVYELFDEEVAKLPLGMVGAYLVLIAIFRIRGGYRPVVLAQAAE